MVGVRVQIPEGVEVFQGKIHYPVFLNSYISMIPYVCSYLMLVYIVRQKNDHF